MSAPPLAAGVDAWADRVLHLLGVAQQDSLACDDIVASSRFSIERSVADLVTVYSGRHLA